MKYFLYFIISLTISCNGKTENADKGYFSNVELSLDTVRIDPGDEVIFLKYGLTSSGISTDSKYLYNFNEYDLTLEKINLEELRLEDKFLFEREGPNGIGPGMAIMKVLNEHQISLTGMYHSSLFSLNGRKLMTVYYENFSLANWHSGGDLLKGDKVIMDPSAKRIYGLIQDYDGKNFKLGILYLDKYETSRLNLKSFERASDYRFRYYLGKGSIINEAPRMGIEKFGTKVILSNETTCDLMWYDTEMDSLFIKSYSSQLTANKKEKIYKLEHATPEEFEIERAKYREEINFMHPFYDSENKIYYRFSYQLKKGKTEVYLTAYDNDLNMIGETFVPQLNKKPAKHFVKDSKIWIYENIDDEMVFVRLGINNKGS
ncbi:DUF4221 family protein [Echinicola salinicaeni]|uniref:DUF4221 family protein n=1 Tax=Echinicola salinicaeni TaxID=2762757 RepID=UPI0016452F03|nr:DUF4221 family protein [Echinicola salinicaeni]